MRNIKIMKISDEDVSKVYGGIKIRTHLDCDGIGDVVDEECFQELLRAFNTCKDEVSVTSSMSIFGDTKSGTEVCNELSFRMKLPACKFEQTPYFLALKQRLEYEMAESSTAE